MESTERLVRTWVASGREQEIEQTVSDFGGGQTTLLNIVKALGEYLTSEEDLLRTKGVEFLAQVISKCPPDKINRPSTRVLVTFFATKLDDTETIIPALKGLVPLTALPAFTSVDAVETMTAIIQHVHMKAHVQTTRYHVFATIDSLMARHRDALKSMGEDFLKGYITLANGEKDPRNLMLAFSIDRVICIEFDISKHIEEMFDITFCYFPITFRPPPDDPYGITSDELKVALRSCFNATPSFGLLAVPQFLEKLTATAPPTKQDTLDTIASCLPVYGPAVARKFANKIWSSFRLEIFQPTDPETEGKALQATQALIQTIYNSAVDGHHTMTGLAKEICEECLEVLREPEKSQAQPAIKVLSALVGTAPYISNYTLAQAIPFLTNTFRNSNEAQNRPQVLLLLSSLITAAKTNVSTQVEDMIASPLSPFKSDLLEILSAGLKSSSTLAPALHGLKQLCAKQGLLTDAELATMVESINEALESDGASTDDNGDSIVELLITISNMAPKPVEETTLPLLFLSLPDQAAPRDAIAERTKHWRVLSWLTRLCVPPPLFETFVVRLSTKLDLLCAPRNSTEGMTDIEPNSAYAHSILVALARTLQSKVDAKHSDVPKYIDRLVPRLYNLFIYLALSPDNRCSVKVDFKLLNVAARTITLITQVLPKERQEVFAASLSSAYLAGHVKDLASGHQQIPSDPPFQPFSTDAPPTQRSLIVLFSSAVIAFRKEVLIPGRDPLEILPTLAWGVEDHVDDFQRSAAHHMMAALLNKHVQAEAPIVVEQLEVFWKQELENSNNSMSRRRAAIQGWVWITKALLVRSHDLVMAFLVDRLFGLFDYPDIAIDAAKAIGQVASGGDDVLTKQNHAMIRMLFAQKFFNAILPRILDGIKLCTDLSRQTAYLVALISLINSMPTSTYIQQMSTLMPHFLRGLDLPDVAMRTNVINTLLAAAESSGKSNAITDHSSSLVAAMLRNSKLQDQTSPALRTAALKYIGILPGMVRYEVLHPHKATVIRELGKVLDDPKRSVRKEAVDARTTWFTFNG